MVTRISWSCLRSPDETLNSGFGGAVAHILLQLDLQVLNLHQLARHIVKHPGMAVPLAITWRRLSYQLCLEKLSLHQPNMLVACCDEEGTARVKDHRGNWLRVRLTNSLCIKKHESWSCYVMLCKSFEGSSNDFLNRALPVHSPVVAEKNAMFRSWSYRYIYHGLCDQNNRTSSTLFRKNLDRLPVQWQQQDRQEREQSDLAGCCPKDKSQSPAP